jgi:cytochrome b pre-mRNA-processing protein 3
MPLQFMPASVNQLSAGCNTTLGTTGTFTKANQGKLMIFGFLRKNNRDRAAIDRQYGLLTAAARQPALYRAAHVPDTVMGRFEMLCVVMILYFRRTASAGKPVKDIAQEIVDAFFQDLDHSMRELGIGDQGVPKRMKKFASMFYGRVASYGKAMDDGDENALAEALRRNFHPETTDSALSMQRLAHYMVEAEAGLAATAETVLQRGEAGMLDYHDGEDR